MLSKLLSHPFVLQTASCEGSKANLSPRPMDLVLREVEVKRFIFDVVGVCAVNDCWKVTEIEVENSRAELLAVPSCKTSLLQFLLYQLLASVVGGRFEWAIQHIHFLLDAGGIR